ncbi:NmrA family NAD(P)-binding protein, partial [Nonomuraea sp. NPDC004297]
VHGGRRRRRRLGRGRHPDREHRARLRRTAAARRRWGSLDDSLEAKSTIQDRVRAAGFARWTILKPAFFMENFLPSMAFLFPRGVEGGLVSVVKPGTRLSLVAVDDIGTAAAAAVADPDRFDRVELELASDHLPMTEIAGILSRALGVRLSAPDMTEQQALAAGMPAMGVSHEWMNVAGQPARPRAAEDLGITLTGFEEWAGRYLRPALG